MLHFTKVPTLQTVMRRSEPRSVWLCFCSGEFGLHFLEFPNIASSQGVTRNSKESFPVADADGSDRGSTLQNSAVPA